MGDGEELLYRLDARLIVGVVTAVALLSVEIAFVVGRGVRRRAIVESEAKDLEAAMLSLLALLLAFTFAMAGSRYDARKRAVLDEANAIGTALTRTDLLAEPARAEVATLLRRYTRARITYQRSLEPSEQRAALAAAKELQERCWSRAVEAVQRTPDAVRALVLASLNDVIDAQSRVTIAFEDHVPESILFAIFFITTTSMAAVGFQNGLSANRHAVLTSLLIACVSVTLVLILDLDRPRRGLIRTTTETLRLLGEDLSTLPP